MDSKRYTLQELVDTYIRFVSCEVFYTNRSQIHEAILEKLGLDIYDLRNDIRANEILHNLDTEIGLIIGVDYDEDGLHKMGKKLVNKLKEGNK